MLAGGGIKGGQVWGTTDDEGREVIDQRVEIPDLNATIAYCLGLPLDEIIYSPTRRPFTLSDKGQPLTKLSLSKAHPLKLLLTGATGKVGTRFLQRFLKRKGFRMEP